MKRVKWRKKKERGPKPTNIGNGAPCPKCGRTMVRKKHSDKWLPKPGQKYYFAYYDWCPRDHHLQHYETAKVWLMNEDPPKSLEDIDPLTAAFKATIN